MKCINCGEQLNKGENFCFHCGAQVVNEQGEKKAETTSSTKTISSAGTYTGTMSKGKTSKGWKFFRNLIIASILVGIIALLIWFQFDPKAGEKLTNIGGGLLIMGIFIFFIYRRAKKGKYKKRNRYEDEYWDDRNNDDFDSDNDDDD